MNELTLRIVTAIGLVAVALIAAVMGGYVFAILAALAATGMFYEWMRIVRGWGPLWAIGGFFYALAPAVSLLWIRDRSGDDGLSLLLWVFLVTWATDIGAYFAGRRFGETKLAPTISPNKTVEGLAGGAVAAALFGAAWVWGTGLSAVLLVLAPLFALAAQAGDLFESGMKRQAGIKDSGNLLPGHGGILDRLDGLVPVAILTFLVEAAGLL